MGTINLTELFEKNTKQFTTITPQGNTISGRILLNHGLYHGSLLIETVNGKPSNQFVRGFPKIHYFDENLDTFRGNNEGIIYGYEKLDGTCIGIYALQDDKGNIIEYVPKSRQRAVLDPHFMEMLNYCELRLLPYYMNLYGLEVVYMELFGMLNEHTIQHRQTYIDVRLIGAVQNKNDNHSFVLPEILEVMSQRLQIPLPRKVVLIRRMGELELYGRTELYEVYFPTNIFTVEENIQQTVYLKTGQEVIQCIKETLDKCNQVYIKEKGYLKYEGVVLQNRIMDKIQYIKIKPDSFYEAENKYELSVPVNEIRKEIQKIINENLTTYDKEYDEKKVIQTIKEMLLEEYTEQDVNHKKTRNTIEKELRKYVDSIQDTSINRIVDNILTNNSEHDLKQLMRYFGKEYPMLKHKSSDVYFVLKKRLEKE